MRVDEEPGADGVIFLFFGVDRDRREEGERSEATRPVREPVRAVLDGEKKIRSGNYLPDEEHNSKNSRAFPKKNSRAIHTNLNPAGHAHDLFC